MMRRRHRGPGFSAAFALALGFLLCAAKAEGSEAPIPHGTIEIVAQNESIEPGRDFNLALHFQLDKGWHIYWANPGDSGEPPRVEWRMPKGVTAEEIEWPAPHRLGTSTIVDYGYQEAVTLIVPVRTEKNLAAQQSAQIDARVKVLICREMCIPGKAQLSLTLPVKSQTAAPNSKAAGLFAAARKSLPQHAPQGWKFSVDDTKSSFVLTGNVGRQTTRAIFFPLNESQIDNAAPQDLAPTDAGFHLTLRKSEQLLKPIARLQGVLVLSDDRAYWIDVPVSKPGAAQSNSGMNVEPQHFVKEG
ncbi:MAG: protein-disulfide reductase DsbD domain-containing protein [Candidatus Acidiferrales bacterium]